MKVNKKQTLIYNKIKDFIHSDYEFLSEYEASECQYGSIDFKDNMNRYELVNKEDIFEIKIDTKNAKSKFTFNTLAELKKILSDL